MHNSKITLHQHLSLQLLEQPNGDALLKLLLAIADSTAQIAELISKGTADEITTKLSSKNVQDETQMQLDLLSNTIFVDQLKETELVAGLVSEELDEAYTMSQALGQLPFLVNFDPLDGSSNIAVNGCFGSIFSVLNAPQNHLTSSIDYLQKGSKQIAAGYSLYGPASMLVLTLGKGTHGYTLDREANTYMLTHADMRIPDEAAEFSINSSNARFWEEPVQRYVAECIAGSDGVRLRDFNMRWVASMVADVHRILFRGGVYLYPKDNKLPLKAGRLRLLYEANPMSFVIEQAGGISSTGRQSLLDIEPSEIHERIPVILGSKAEVNLIEQYHKAFDAGHFDQEVISENNHFIPNRS